MSPRKLTPDDKQEILDLYRQTPETTSTLAERFGVSSSTISRFLKAQLLDEEYEVLIQQKRLARTARTELDEEVMGDFDVSSASLETEPRNPPRPKPISPVVAYLPKRVIDDVPGKEAVEELTAIESLIAVEALTLGELFGEEITALDPEDDDLEDDEDEDDELDEDEDWEESEGVDFTDAIANQEAIKVLPLSDADFPRICYLVIDRTSELIARPLKEFSHLGMIPAEETLQKTLPVFDNHRVARRFSNRFQRVIKVPDGKLLQKTSPHLKAKGITRLIMDGRIYSLSSL
jgi:transposase-like protein